MQLGLTTAIFPKLTLGEIAGFCRENRIGVIEPMCWPPASGDQRKYAGVVHIDVRRVLQDGANWVYDQLGDNVTISGLGYYPNPLATSHGRVYTNHLKQVIQAAKILGVSVVNSFIGRDPSRPVEDQWKRVRNVWWPLVRLAEDCGVVIGIENCPMRFTLDEWPGGLNLANCPANWRRLFATIDSPNLGLNYDPSHRVLTATPDAVIRDVKEFGKKFVHMHAKDLSIETEGLYQYGVLGDCPKDWHTPLIPGRGSVPWGAMFEALHKVGYDGPMTIEIEQAGLDNLDQCRTAVIEARDFLEPFFVAPESEVTQV